MNQQWETIDLEGQCQIISIPILCAVKILRPKISYLCRHRPLRVPLHTLVSGALEIHFFCPEEFTLDRCRIRTRDLLICSRTRYHWTNAPCPVYNCKKYLHKLIKNARNFAITFLTTYFGFIWCVEKCPIKSSTCIHLKYVLSTINFINYSR